MARTIDDVGLLVAAMARDHSIDPMSYPRDRNDFLDLEVVDLKSIRVAFSPDLGFAPTSKMIRRVFDDRVGRIKDLFGKVEITQPDLTMAARTAKTSCQRYRSSARFLESDWRQVDRRTVRGRRLVAAGTRHIIGQQRSHLQSSCAKADHSAAFLAVP